MADNFGTRQDRVLTVADRSLDNVVFQRATLPLSSEWNLINQIGNQKVQDLSRVMLPSGWMNVGGIYQDKDESLLSTGEIDCSYSYASNSIKLCGTGNNIAMVNGWPILVRGTNNSLDDNNVIYLSDPIGQMYDFVFLEVWRKLIAYNEQVYPYGNTLKTPLSPNEIKWDSVGIETTKRVQIQYKIRTVQINTFLTSLNDVNHTGDVFTEWPVYPIGGSISGEITSYPYAPFGASDGGLYVAGNGDSANLLNTVDGYVYAIPMLLVYRRALTVGPFTSTTVNTTKSTKSTLDDGYAADRPDNKVVDVVYKEDIVDFRHKVVTSTAEADKLLNESISKLIAGNLATSVKYGFGENGAITASSSGGSELMKVEQLNAVSGVPSIGTGNSASATAFKRRAHCNAGLLSDHNIIEYQRPGGGAWVVNDTFDVATLVGASNGSVFSVDGFYTTSTDYLTNDYLINDSIEQVGGPTSTIYKVTSNASPNLVGNSKRLMIEYTVLYSSSSRGFKDVPNEFLEIRKGETQQIATRDNGTSGIPVRFNNSGITLQDSSDVVTYKGGNYTENSYFGHEMAVHYADLGLTSFSITLADGKYNNHILLGVKKVETRDTSLSPWVSVTFTQTRSIVASPYSITGYTITLPTSGPATRVTRVTFYTGSKYINTAGDTYSAADSCKFFELSKQGRGVVDTYEMIEAIAVRTLGDVFVLDTTSTGVGDKPIISLATTFQSGSVRSFGFDTTGVCIAIAAAPTTFPILSSSDYAADATPTMMKITVNGATGNAFRVPVLVHSYVESTETPYSFYYKTVPYQGLLTASTNFYGKIEKEGPALITSLGSGAVVNFSYTTGKVQVTNATKSIVGIVDTNGNLPLWTQYVQAGDYFIVNTGAGDQEHIFTRYYKIETVVSDIGLTLTENFEGSSSSSANYEIIRLDVPSEGVSNVIDRLPAYKIIDSATSDVTDYRCESDLMDVYGDGVNTYSSSTLTTSPQLKSNDPLNAWVNDFKLGDASVSKRGRNNFVLSSGTNPAFRLTVTGQNPRPIVSYQSILSTGKRKVAQVYLFQRSGKDMLLSGAKDLTGRLYLMVVTSEVADSVVNKLNGFSPTDTVDVFELSGRPIIKL